MPVRLTVSDEAFAESFGLQPTVSTYEGPTGINGVLSLHLRKKFRTASLSTMTPFYVGAEQNPHAMVALVESIDRLLGTATPLGPVLINAAGFDQQVLDAVGDSEELRELVRTLEAQYDGFTSTTTVAPGTGCFAQGL